MKAAPSKVSKMFHNINQESDHAVVFGFSILIKTPELDVFTKWPPIQRCGPHPETVTSTT